MSCSSGEKHCCWVDGQPCQFLRENEGGRRWACALMLELGDWESVHADPRYADIGAFFQSNGIADCGDYPGPGAACGTCGEVG